MEQQQSVLDAGWRPHRVRLVASGRGLAILAANRGARRDGATRTCWSIANVGKRPGRGRLLARWPDAGGGRIKSEQRCGRVDHVDGWQPSDTAIRPDQI